MRAGALVGYQIGGLAAYSVGRVVRTWPHRAGRRPFSLVLGQCSFDVHVAFTTAGKGYRCIESHGLGSWQRLGARDGVDSPTADPTRHGCPDRIHITRRWIWRVGQQAQIFAPRERKPGALLLCHRRTKHSGVSNQDHQTRWSLFRRCLSQRTQHPTM
jgi:hypothetical protein